MRLSCPRCDALYEVPDSAIPESGRDVQCTNCGHTWFHRPQGRLSLGPAIRAPEPEPEAEIEAEGEGEADAPPAAAGAPRRAPIDPEVRRVLREEAEREMEARRGERRPRPVEARAAPYRRPRAGAARLEPPREEESGLSPALASAEVRRAGPPRGRRRGGGAGFAAGFLGTLLVAALLAASYLYAGALGAAIPAIERPMASYQRAVDEGRLVVDAAARAALARLDALRPSPVGG